MRLTILIIAFLSIVASAMAGDLTIPEDKAVIQFDTKIGVITFAHKKHAGLSITECTTCHHKIEAGDSVVKPCHECHLEKSKEPPKIKNALHTRCTGCHEYTVAGGQKAGPLKKKCKLCHIKPSAE